MKGQGLAFAGLVRGRLEGVGETGWERLSTERVWVGQLMQQALDSGSALGATGLASRRWGPRCPLRLSPVRALSRAEGGGWGSLPRG